MMHNPASNVLTEHFIKNYSRGGYDFIRRSDIIYCKADGNQTNIFINRIKKNVIVVNFTLKEMEKRLGNFTFLRCHATYLINLNYVLFYSKKDGGTFMLQGIDGEIEIDVSKKYHGPVTEMLKTI